MRSGCGHGARRRQSVGLRRRQVAFTGAYRHCHCLNPGEPAGLGTTPAAAVPPAIVAVTKHGALVALDPATGTATKTLVASGVEGDEVSVSGSGMVYFAVKQGCNSEIEAVPADGGSVAQITAGGLPAVTADGSKLAYASQPTLTSGCVPSSPELVRVYKLEVRTLSSGTDAPAAARGQDTGLPYPISHLSWAPDNDHLAVSISSAEDNEGWNLVWWTPRRRTIT